MDEKKDESDRIFAVSYTGMKPLQEQKVRKR